MQRPLPQARAWHFNLDEMGQLYDVVRRVEEICERRGLHPYKTKGQIAMRVGFVLSFIGADTPDDPTQLQNLKQAVWELLHESV